MSLSLKSVRNDEFGPMSDSKLREEIFDLLYTKQKPEVAVLRLNRVLEGDPSNEEAISFKAYALNKLANATKDWNYTKNALASADKALPINPVNDFALVSKGWALIDLGNAREAIPCLVRATTTNPNNEYAWYNLAWAQFLTGNSAESSSSIAKALELSPNNAIIRRGRRMMMTGNLPAHLRKSTLSDSYRH